MKEFLSGWFKAGLKEFGITVKEYRALPKKEQNDIKEALAEFGHF